MKTIDDMMIPSISCRECGKMVSELEIFPGKRCLPCHERKFNLELMKTGKLPVPDFKKTIKR